MRKTGSELTSEMVGPAGSIADGAFSRWIGCEDELWSFADLEAGPLSGDCARACETDSPAKRQKTNTARTENDRLVRKVIGNPCLQVYSGTSGRRIPKARSVRRIGRGKWVE